MSDTDRTATEPAQTPRRKLWPWVITSIVALLAALFLTVWTPQKQDSDLLAQIEAAGGSYSIDTAGRPEAGSYLPEAGSILDDMEYVELFDRVNALVLPRVSSELFRDAVAAFKSLESLEIDLENSVDFDRETAVRLTKLEWLDVNAYHKTKKSDYAFLAGCRSVEVLTLKCDLHDDGFWQYLPEMQSLTHLEATVGPHLRGEDIPNLSKSNLESIVMTGDLWTDPEFHGLTALLTAPRLKELQIFAIPHVDIQPVTLSGSPALEVLEVNDAGLADDILPILAQCKSLRNLDLFSNQIAGESLDLLASLPLNTLILSRNPLTEKACQDLARFQHLHDLSVWKTEIKSEWLACWADSPLASNLRILSLSSREFDDDVIDVLMTFSKLRRLKIYQRDYSNEAILKLVDHPSLEVLEVDGKVSNVLFEKFWERMKERGRTLPEIR